MKKNDSIFNTVNTDIIKIPWYIKIILRFVDPFEIEFSGLNGDPDGIITMKKVFGRTYIIDIKEK